MLSTKLAHPLPPLNLSPSYPLYYTGGLVANAFLFAWLAQIARDEADCPYAAAQQALAAIIGQRFFPIFGQLILLEAALYFCAAGGLIAYTMDDSRVTIDELFAAGATFTLLAWGFAYAYLVCQAWLPGSFVGGTNAGQPRTFIELMFLSFTNLSATGIGDILPINSWARVLVMLEQFAGVGYIAVVVSRLIGMTIVRQNRKGAS